MKRTHSGAMADLTTLPTLDTEKALKSILEGRHQLKVVKAIDISKPTDKPVDDIEEPEEDEALWEKRQSKNNARMIQLELRDATGNSIKAIETEPIDLLNKVKPGSVVCLAGPADIRCRNIMLEKRHVTNVEDGPKEETTEQRQEQMPREMARQPQPPLVELDLEDWDDNEEDDCIIIE